MIEHECTPPPSSANIAATFICWCGARWDTYPTHEMPTWRRGTEISRVLTTSEFR